MNTFISVFNGYLRAFGIMTRHGLWKYTIIPGLISIAVGSVLYNQVTAHGVDQLIDWVNLEWAGDYFEGILRKGLTGVLYTLTWIIFFFIYKYLMLILLSPFMSLLSEKLEKQITDIEYEAPFSITRWISEMVRGGRIALGNLFKELFLILVVFILGVIFPFVSVFSAIAIFMIQAYYAGFGNHDYFLERYMNVREAKQFNKRHKLLTIANGTFYLLLLFIPVIGLFVAAPLATVVATEECIKRLEPEEFD